MYLVAQLRHNVVHGTGEEVEGTRSGPENDVGVAIHARKRRLASIAARARHGGKDELRDVLSALHPTRWCMAA